MARRKNKLSKIYVISLLAHLAVGGVLALIPQKKLREVVAIALNEAPPKDEKKPEPPKPQPHPAEHTAHAPTHVAHSSAAPQTPTAATATAAPAFTDLGLTLDSSASGGLAVNIQPPAPVVVRPPAALVVKPKTLAPRNVEPSCTQELIKARPLALVRPQYTDDARRAHVQGRIRIELAIDDHGEVTEARLVEGLGHGLDEAALEAAKRLKFNPATHCDRPVAAPFVLSMRFVLDT